MMKKREQIAGGGGEALEPQAVGLGDMARADGLLKEVASCMAGAAAGQALRLKAGCGLLMIRDLVPHGGWAEYVGSRFPQSSYRTVSRVAAEAARFCGECGVKAQALWEEMGPGGLKLLSAAQGSGGRLGRADSGEAPGRALRKAAQWLFGDREAGPEKRLTAEERAEAFRDAARKVCEGAEAWTRANAGRVHEEELLEGMELSLMNALREVRRAKAAAAAKRGDDAQTVEG